MLRSAFRAGPRWLLLVPGAVFLLALVAGAVHHHVNGGGARDCAICSLGHAPVTPAAAVAAEAPALRSEHVVVEPQERPRPARIAAAPSRAPPSA
jgi:hypothetical protein